MLNSYLEHRLQKKLRLFYLLISHTPASLHLLTESLETSEANVKNMICELNSAFDGLACIQHNQQSYSLVLQACNAPQKLLHAIYRDSATLHCLKFMITNNKHKPYWNFIEESFYSTASAYRIKKNCTDYLNAIGLIVENNMVTGEEYRIRYLIALLYYKYGFDCCGIDETSKKLAKDFILATNYSIDRAFLETTANEYAYFETLLILSWKRKKYAPFSEKSEQLHTMMAFFDDQKVRKYLHTYIEQPLNITFSELDYDYIFLIYCSTNNCILTDKWTYDSYDKIHDFILASDLGFSNLSAKLSHIFGKEIAECHAMQVAIMYLLKKFVLNLQCIIPDSYFYSDSQKNPITRMLVRMTEQLLNSWKEDNHILYPIDPDHILYFALQLGTVLRQFTKPIPIVIVADQLCDLEGTELLLRRRFSSERIEITYFSLNANDINLLYDLKDCVIILNKKFRHMKDFTLLSEQNSIISVTIEFNNSDIAEIEAAIHYYEELHFRELLHHAEELLAH